MGVSDVCALRRAGHADMKRGLHLLRLYNDGAFYIYPLMVACRTHLAIAVDYFYIEYVEL